MRDVDFDALLRWLHERLGRRVSISMQARAGNISLHASGTLAESDDTIMAIDPAPGRRSAFRIGDARVVLFEGELVGAEFDEPENVTVCDRVLVTPARATATFRHVEILFGDWSGR